MVLKFVLLGRGSLRIPPIVLRGLVLVAVTHLTLAGARTAQLLVCRKCRGIGHFGCVCQGGRKSLRGAPRPPPYVSPCTQVVQVDQPVDQHFPRVNASAVADIFEPAPTILIGMSALNVSCTFPVVPDSGADISVAGLAMLECLNEHPDNLLSSSVTPRAVNGSTMSPIGKLPLSLQNTPTNSTFTHRLRGLFFRGRLLRG